MNPCPVVRSRCSLGVSSVSVITSGRTLLFTALRHGMRWVEQDVKNRHSSVSLLLAAYSAVVMF